MKTMCFAFLVVTCSTIMVFGQQTDIPSACRLTAAQAPQVRGLRLGMSLNEFLAFFPENRPDIQYQLVRFENPQNYGVNGLNLDQPIKFAGDAFKGISGIRGTFVDKRLRSFDLSYENTRWATIDEFIDKLGEFFSLPKASTWTLLPQGEASPIKIVRCIDVELFANIQTGYANGQNSRWGVTAIPTPSEQARQRKQEAEAKAAQAFKQTFKP